MKKFLFAAMAFAFLLAVPPSEAEAQVSFGPQAVLWDFDEFGLGARADFGLADALDIEEGAFSQLRASTNVSYLFGDSQRFNGGEASWSGLLINANAIVPFETDGAITPFAGAGINHTRFSSSVSGNGFAFGSFSGSSSGLNLLGGIEFDLGAVPAFTELQYSTSGAGNLNLSLGVMFGG